MNNVLVMVVSRAMCVAMLEFLGQSSSDRNDLNCESKGFPSHLVIEINSNGIVIDSHDGKLNRPLITLRSEYDTHFKGNVGREFCTRNRLNRFIIPLPIGSVGSQSKFPRFTNGRTQQLLFETFDHVPMPDQET